MKIKKTLLFLLSLLFLLPCCPPAAYTAAEHAAARPFREVYPMAADPDTSRFSENFSQSTVENGRIWIDKTVNTDSVTFYDVNGRPVSNVTAAPDEFLVTLSALSQSYSVETVVEPTDAVFILDVSGSMHSNNLGNQTRATVMVQALNSAVDKLMRANPANRVSVVAYGGYAQGTTNVTRLDKLLSLGHYELPNGNYFNIDNSRTPPQITPAPALSGQNAAVGSTTVAGGTPTQRGIYEGAKILMDNTDTTLDYVTEKGRVVTLTRRPALILLSDGEPTFGWGDYRVGAASTDTGYTSGNGIVSGGTLGLDLLTIASASYWKKQVGDHYYGQGGASPWFYTIGVGVTNDHERAVLDPINNVQKITIRYNSADYSLKTLLDSFIAGNTVRFPAPNKNSAALGLIDVENYGKYVTNYAYADGYYQANDQNALSGAFDAIAAQIISKGHYTTESDAAKPDFSGYLVISDILGEHMEFREPKGFILYGQNRYGQNLAMELQKGPSGPEWAHYVSVLAEQLGVGAAVAADIVKTSIAGGSMYYNGDEDFRSALMWYADKDTEYAGLYYTLSGEAVPPPADAACVVDMHPLDGEVFNEVSGEYTDLMYSFMSVTTALVPGGFGLKNAQGVFMPLLAGQQMVRWYIPASLIPLRTVGPIFDEDNLGKVETLGVKETLPIRANFTVGLESGFSMDKVPASYRKKYTDNGKCRFFSDSWQYGDGETKHNATVAFFRPNKENPYYFFPTDTPVYVRDNGSYRLAGSEDGGDVYYWLDEHFDQNVNGYLVRNYVRVNQVVTAVSYYQDGTPYVPAGARKEMCFEKVTKSPNLTSSYDFRLKAEPVGENELYMLGNNGRLEIGGLTSVSVRKDWETDLTEPVWAGLYADGNPIMEPAELSDANEWAHTWDDLLTYSTKIDADGNVSPVIYTVREGFIEDGAFTAYDDENAPEWYEISYKQPVWDGEANAWTEAVITNGTEAVETPEPTETGTPEPTETGTPEPTDTESPEPTETETHGPVITEPPMPTEEIGEPEPTETPSPEPTETGTPEPTETESPEPTETETHGPVITEPPMPTEEIGEPEPTETPSPEPTETETHGPVITEPPMPTEEIGEPEPTETPFAPTDTPSPTATPETPPATETPSPTPPTTATPPMVTPTPTQFYTIPPTATAPTPTIAAPSPPNTPTIPPIPTTPPATPPPAVQQPEPPAEPLLPPENPIELNDDTTPEGLPNFDTDITEGEIPEGLPEFNAETLSDEIPQGAPEFDSEVIDGETPEGTPEFEIDEGATPQGTPENKDNPVTGDCSETRAPVTGIILIALQAAAAAMALIYFRKSRKR